LKIRRQYVSSVATRQPSSSADCLRERPRELMSSGEPTHGRAQCRRELVECTHRVQPLNISVDSLGVHAMRQRHFRSTAIVVTVALEVTNGCGQK
jgi:hypothetical protein